MFSGRLVALPGLCDLDTSTLLSTISMSSLTSLGIAFIDVHPS